MELDIVDVNLNARSNNNYKIFTVIYMSYIYHYLYFHKSLEVYSVENYL